MQISQSTEELRTFINDAKNSIKQLEEQIGNALKQLPSAILPESMIGALSKDLRAEEILLSHNLSKDRGEGKIEDFQKAFANNPSALEVVARKPYKATNCDKPYAKHGTPFGIRYPKVVHSPYSTTTSP